MSMTDPLRIAIAGVAGRMGKELLSAVTNDVTDVVLAAATARPGSDLIGRDAGSLIGRELRVNIKEELDPVEFDLLIDFTNPELTLEHCTVCAEHGKSLVIGTTGFSPDQLTQIESVAQQTPILLAPNMSVGVNLLFHLLQQAAAAIGADADIEINETHHRHKLDAPSGTALRMGEVIANAMGQELEDCAVYDRHGVNASRQSNSIGFSSIRAGDVIGDHTALFATEGERLEISHKASSREIYASGALRAARWLQGQPAGLYSMQNVLGLNSMDKSD